jgi:hypothetical protein
MMTPVSVFRSRVFICKLGEIMQVFATLMALLGTFAALSYYFTFWIVLGVVYLAGLLVVAMIAFRGRGRQMSDRSIPEEEPV